MPTSLPIRAATPADLPDLHALIERAYRGETARRGWTHEADLLKGQRTDVATLAAIIGDPAQQMLLAHDGERLIGCIQLSDRGGGLAYLGQLAVEPARQAAGLGKRLLAAAEAAAIGFGATRIEMTVVSQRPELVAYYSRRGYALTGEARPFPFDQPPRADPLCLEVMTKSFE